MGAPGASHLGTWEIWNFNRLSPCTADTPVGGWPRWRMSEMKSSKDGCPRCLAFGHLGDLQILRSGCRATITVHAHWRIASNFDLSSGLMPEIIRKSLNPLRKIFLKTLQIISAKSLILNHSQTIQSDPRAQRTSHAPVCARRPVSHAATTASPMRCRHTCARKSPIKTAIAGRKENHSHGCCTHNPFVFRNL
jgi:hypothetical protein